MNQAPPASQLQDHRRIPASAGDLPPGYVHHDGGIDFSKAVPDNGYLWWYVDATSDDGQQAMTLIVFVGSVFSPYYARARRRGSATAEQYCAFNAILYGPGGRKRWSMTERSASSLQRSRDSYALGPSAMTWDGTTLEAHINEYCVPTPRPMRGTIRVTPAAITTHSLMLDYSGHHRWYPLAPTARVEIDFPGLGARWSGNGYLDSNSGSEPLADGFTGWDWLRMHTDKGDCRVRYEAREQDRQPHRLALRFAPDGTLTNEEPCSASKLPTTPVWRIERRLPDDAPSHILKTLEDTPFYARSLIHCDDPELQGTGFHESLSMERFDTRWVQTLLPFRMPRITK